jgi:hypothetical protein
MVRTQLLLALELKFAMVPALNGEFLKHRDAPPSAA